MSKIFSSPYYTGLPVIGAYKRAPVVAITRPNNVTAYAIGDVYGASPSALVTIVLGVTPGKTFNIRMLGVHYRNPVSTSLGIYYYLFTGFAPVTVIDDNAQLVLSDADVDLNITSQQAPMNTSFGAVGYKWALDPNGARAASSASALTSTMPFGGNGNVYAYLMVNAAYTPIALERLTLHPFVYEW